MKSGSLASFIAAGAMGADYGVPDDGEDLPTPLQLVEQDLAATALRLAKLWLAVRKYDRIGFEGSDLLEEMSEARVFLDAYHGSDEWRK